MISKRELELRIATLELAVEDLQNNMTILISEKKKAGRRKPAAKKTTKKSNVKGVY